MKRIIGEIKAAALTQFPWLKVRTSETQMGKQESKIKKRESQRKNVDGRGSKIYLAQVELVPNSWQVPCKEKER